MLPVTETIAKRAEAVTLSPAERSRYSRHILLPEVGLAGQRRLKAARILVIGAGGLGAPISLYLAAAGIGTIGLVEFDSVDATNLQRQILYRETDVGQPKIAAAARRLKELNSGIELVCFDEPMTQANATRIIHDFDIVIDGTDNFATRYLVSDACVWLGKPLVYGSIFRFEGQASVFYPPLGPCYRCLYPSPPPPQSVPNCAEGGVLGVLPGQIGVLQATEALKLVTGAGEPLIGRLLTYEALSLRFDQYTLRRDPDCPSCSDARRALPAPSYTPAAEVGSCSVPEAGAPLTSQPSPTSAATDELITVDAYAELRRTKARHLLLDVRSAGEVAVVAIPDHQHIPLALLSQCPAELPRNQPIIVYCKSGARSLKAVRLLRSAGYQRALSLDGGILAWIRTHAPELPLY